MKRPPRVAFFISCRGINRQNFDSNRTNMKFPLFMSAKKNIAKGIFDGDT
jgi:hypothetical protein